jgi:hypothetical protein
VLVPDPGGASSRSGPAAAALTLYVEGPRDRSILRAWAHRLIPQRASRVLGGAVILGGRQPVRALEHFERHCAGVPGARALCVLDRDDGASAPPDPNGFELEFFTWSRRHIESYLIVPAAIRRALGLPEHDRRIERAIERLLPGAGDEDAWRDLDAKRLLGPQGALTRALGLALPLSRIARATREHELHEDVLALFARVEALMTRVASAPRDPARRI